ncbi:MAG: Hsp20 family protein [Candidatus Bathyarchaeia archaeon]|nr:Hsp20/alpha crystallin family protein [Candidatus Bathyarchaeota archaeon]
MEKKEKRSFFEDLINFMNLSWDEEASIMQPLYNILLKPNEVVVTVDLPYADLNKIEVKAVENKLEVLAKTKEAICLSKFGLKHRSGEFNCYHIVVQIPVPVDWRRLTYRLKRGILEVHLPRL